MLAHQEQPMSFNWRSLVENSKHPRADNEHSLNAECPTGLQSFVTGELCKSWRSENKTRPYVEYSFVLFHITCFVLMRKLMTSLYQACLAVIWMGLFESLQILDYSWRLFLQL